MKHTLSTIVLFVSTALASGAGASTPSQSVQVCKLVDSRDQAVDNYLDINYYNQWSSHTSVEDNGDTEVFMYINATSNKINPVPTHMTVTITKIGNKYKCQK